MTFSIVGYDAAADQVGIGLTTVTMAAGGTCPSYSPSGDIVVVQAFGNPVAGIAGVRALEAGQGLDRAVAAMRESDPSFDYRQIGIVTRDGALFSHTGENARPWAGHIQGDDFVAMGNVLVSGDVVDAMAAAFTASAGEALAERLLRALEAGRDAGGQQGPGGRHYDESSCLLKVIGNDVGREVPALDLRIDMTSDAVTEMRRFWEIYKPVVPFRAARAADPASIPSTYDWERENLSANPPPSTIKGEG
ncbi:MAG: DUF1028 domain-containing protein [Rhodospirillaceae bacterium]|nr:DUF1028 domain-containing protein [Rhodospirillaceae bacterium]